MRRERRCRRWPAAHDSGNRGFRGAVALQTFWNAGAPGPSGSENREQATVRACCFELACRENCLGTRDKGRGDCSTGGRSAIASQAPRDRVIRRISRVAATWRQYGAVRLWKVIAIRSSEFVLCRETQAFPSTRQKGIDATVPHLHCAGHSSCQSRIPGLSRWVLNQRGDSGHAVRLFKGECDDGFAARIVP